ncbi:TlpA family protein disulfide reductase [Pseudomonas sp. SST3]|uniref:TlpA family protein disulfide reductase n=1 Tax=Pseudomonas sp. SST3 TaxID=2267882 RepID=UPI000DFF25A2|nr:TlpA disulfide reductase family protein [Pseudomonas sp. SST3]NKQ12602.1 TlpA family protein disulfide reductase [Pseudomonas sp. SST3]
MQSPFLLSLIKKFLALLVLGSALHLAHADDSLDDEGARRARTAGASLIGQLAPVAVLETIDGEKIDLAELYGKKPVYLKFWATWCVPCRQQMPGFEQLQQTMGDKVQVIAVNTGFSDDIDSIRAYRKEHQLTMPIVIDDGSLAADLNLRVTPQHVVIGRDGRIFHIGHLDDQALHAALENAVSEQTASTSRSQANAAPETPQFTPGDTVTDLNIETLDGEQVQLGKGGKPRALVFFAPWCESYLEESRPETSLACLRVRKDVDSLMDQGDIEWLGVSSGLWVSASDLQDYKNTTPTTLPLALDEQDELFRAFAIRDIPTVVLLDAQGRVANILKPQDNNLVEAVKALR